MQLDPTLPPIRAAAADRPADKAFRIAGAAGAALQITAAADGDANKLPRFAGVAYTGQPMRPCGWGIPIIVDLAGVRIPSQHRPALRQHDPLKIGGHTDLVKVTDKGIEIAGVFSGIKNEWAQEIVDLARNGFQWQLSIGAEPVRIEYLESGQETVVNGRTVTGPMDISRETELGEFSFVPLGADGDTSATVSASKHRGSPPMNFKAALKQLKLAKYSDEDIDKMTDTEAKAALKEAMKGEGEPDDKPKPKEEDDKKTQAALADLLQSARTETAKELRRQQNIQLACQKHGVVQCEVDGKKVNLAAHAIENNWTEERAELFALKAARPGPGVGVVPGGLGYSVSSPEINEQVLAAAVMQAAEHEFRLADDSFYFDDNGNGAKVRRVPEYVQRRAQAAVKAAFSEQAQDYARRTFHGRIGLQQLIVASARLNGYTGTDRMDDGSGEEILRFAAGSRYGGIRAEGASTASIANIVANVQNKFLLQGYLFVEQAWREFSAIRPVADFKPTKSINLLADATVKPVGPNGELEDAVLSDQAFANQADQFGRKLTINRKNLINDDLGALTGAPQKLGQGAGTGLNTLIYCVFNGNPTADDGNSFWNTTGTPATHGAPSNPLHKSAGPNYASGGGTALSSSGLQQAKLMFDNQVDPNGNPLGFDAGLPILLFPPDLWQTAMELVDPAAVGLIYGGGSAAKQPNINLWKGRMRPVMSRYLNKTLTALVNGSYVTQAGSSSAYYVLFNPVVLPVFEVAFVGGVDVPTVQTAGADFQFDRLGLTMRVVFDYGCNYQNFRGGVKMAGA